MRPREELIAAASWWAGWCTDNDLTLPRLAELSDLLLELKHRIALDRADTACLCTLGLGHDHPEHRIDKEETR